ncbi:MAG: putative membrane protein [Spirosomataceae bacterium]|jgi:uncharacterized membrane protein
MQTPLITNDAIIFGILLCLLAVVFKTANSEIPFFKKFYAIFPPILLCYFLPGILNTTGVVDGAASQLYPVASRYLLPATLVYFTLNVDFKAISRLGSKAILVFLAGTLGIIIGGPIAVLIVKQFDPQLFTEGDEVWRGLAAIAGSWIGGGANQTALKEVFQPSDAIFSQAVAVDILVAETWLAVLLIGVGKSGKIDKWLKADSSSIEEIKQRINAEEDKQRIPRFDELVLLAAVGFGATAVAHWLGDIIAPFLEANYPFLKNFSLTSSFFWIVTIVTILGLIFSQTKLRDLENVGATKVGTLFLYILIATIGMQMDITAIFNNPSLFAIGIIWMLVHVITIIIVAKLIKAPYFFMAVGSQANVGGAASAPIVAAAFHPSLAPVGVLLSVLGYAIGTYAGYVTSLLMKWASVG